MTNTFEGWAIVELMGHRKVAGLVSSEEVGGVALIRIDVPGDNGVNVATQYYNPTALYCLTPTTEDLARKVARGNQPAPVTRWELPKAVEDRPRRQVLLEEADIVGGEDY